MLAHYDNDVEVIASISLHDRHSKLSYLGPVLVLSIRLDKAVMDICRIRLNYIQHNITDPAT